ncbi:hypothetical protein VTH06DRAFT_1167 [Thermothelomyces fergusii]
MPLKRLAVAPLTKLPRLAKHLTLEKVVQNHTLPGPYSPIPRTTCIILLAFSLFQGYIRLPRNHGERQLNPCSHIEQNARLPMPTPCNVDDKYQENEV